MALVSSLSGGEANNFVKYKKTTLGGKDEVRGERGRACAAERGEQGVSAFLHTETNLDA